MPITKIWGFSECILQPVSLMPSRKWAMTTEETQYFNIDVNMSPTVDKLGIIAIERRCHSCCLSCCIV